MSKPLTYDQYTALLSRYCAANLRRTALTPEEWRALERYEAERPAATCPRCEKQQRSIAAPYRVVHPIDECKPKKGER